MSPFRKPDIALDRRRNVPERAGGGARSRQRRFANLAPCWAIFTLSACGGKPPVSPMPKQPISTVKSPGAKAAGPAEPRTLPEVTKALETIHVAPSGHNLIKNATFDTAKSLPWTASFTMPADGEAHTTDGAYCLQVAHAGKNPWDAQVRHREMTIQKGHAYSVRFKIAATAATSLTAKVAMSGPPYKAYWQMAVDLDAGPQIVTSQFTMNEADNPTAELAFHAGGREAAKTPFSICIDDVVIDDPAFVPVPDAAPPPIPNVLVNQVAYLPGAEKIAIVKSTSTTPLPWELLDRSNATAARGETTVHGGDPLSGDSVHWLDLSSFSKPGTGYVLRVGDSASHPFGIDSRVYRKLKYEALNFFYQNRSGIPIILPYADDVTRTRAAGHPTDKSVHCAPDAQCDYALDVSGGWYDAGDHGKYVVNGGIAVWTLQNEYERLKFYGTTLSDFADGKMRIPENKNGFPDLLDEARWELEFMMKMQVTAGRPMAGMAHHKVHDVEWTALATRPDQDSIKRYLRPVSTAATLNLAAATAQCARVWKGIDDLFASRCLASSEAAWSAAIAHPALLALRTDNVGGGPYEDSDVSDDFYWAASELFVTTKKPAYRDFIHASPHYLSADVDRNEPTPMTWQRTATLGTVSLSVVPNGLPAEEVNRARKALLSDADTFVKMAHESGYHVGFAPLLPLGFSWGSNSSILNNAIILALAYDFSRDPRYLDAVEDAMDYLLGRNPNDQSYVTGYGYRPLQNLHHRFWAHQANSTFPSPPPGVLSGGPNSGLQDPYVKAAGLVGCAPMKCFADNIEAYSVNEEAINWNAPLAWVTAFLDEQGRESTRETRGARGRQGQAQ